MGRSRWSREELSPRQLELRVRIRFRCSCGPKPISAKLSNWGPQGPNLCRRQRLVRLIDSRTFNCNQAEGWSCRRGKYGMRERIE